CTGFRATQSDRAPGYTDTALARAAGSFAKKVRDASKGPEVMARLAGDPAGDGVAQADLVIEAIIEDAAAKRGLYGSLEPRLKEGALLASNTSSIPVAELAEGLQRPGQFAGLHYFNPVALMPLVEIG